MTPTLRLILLGIVGAMMAVTATWQALAHFDLDSLAFLAVFALLPVPVLGGLFYTYFRRDDRIAAMLLGYSFLVIFSPCCSVLTYFAIAVAGSNIDATLAALDRAAGFHWPSLMQWTANHPWFSAMLPLAYRMSVWQVLIIVALIGFNGDAADIGKLCLSVAVCGIATVIIWTIHPSFGAIAVYGLPTEVGGKLILAVNMDYTHKIMEVMKHGPGHITPAAVKGIIGFPSFHTQESIIGIWFTRKNRYLFPLFLLLNILSLVATPIEGGHHLMDVVGGAIVAVAGIALASFIADRAAARDAHAGHILAAT